MTSIIREMKNARKIYMKKPFSEREALIKKTIDDRLKNTQEKHFVKANLPRQQLNRIDKRILMRSK
jgi:hypothetical protein